MSLTLAVSMASSGYNQKTGPHIVYKGFGHAES